MTQIIAIIDGTLSHLETGYETHAGKLFKLALKLPLNSRRIFYDPGVQGVGAKKWLQVASGTGLNLSISKIYQKISEHYQPGDQLYLFGYSRGAYAVRLVAGMIDRIGLLRPEYASPEKAEEALKLYAQINGKLPDHCHDFQTRYTRGKVNINFLGVWDTVPALGLRIPFFRHLAPFQVPFKNLRVPEIVQIACHALAKDEDRWLYEPALWASAAPSSKMKQMLFAGDHAVVGGNVLKNQDARKLGNYSFHWMMEEALQAGFQLTKNWQNKFPLDPCAPDHDDPLWYEHIWLREPRIFTPPDYFKDHPSIALRKKCANL